MKPLKRIMTLCFALVIALTLSFALAACNEPPETPENEQTQQGSGGGETDGGGATDESGNAEIRKNFQEVYGKISDLLFDAYAADQQSSAPAAKRLTAFYATEEDIYAEKADTVYLTGATAYIYMAGELYKDENFPVSDGAVGYTAAFDAGGVNGQADFTMISDMDAETGEILLQLGIETKQESGGTFVSLGKTYIYIDADYDFAEKTVENLLIHIWNEADGIGGQLLISAKYGGETFLQAGGAYKEEVAKSVSSLYASFNEQSADKTAAGDRSAEYERANEYMAQKISGLVSR